MEAKVFKVVEIAEKNRLIIFTPILLLSIFIIAINISFKKSGYALIALVAHLFFISTFYEFLWRKTMFWLVSIPYEKNSYSRLFLFIIVLAMFIGACIKDLKAIW